MKRTINGWDVVYTKAIWDDGSLLFPNRLTEEFLEQAKRTMGSYFFANQYLNEVIPLEDRVFKPEWIKYYSKIPDNVNTFVFIDPAMSESDTSDYTGLVIVSIDEAGSWYIRVAKRLRYTPTQLIQLVFKIYEEFKPTTIGIEAVAYQKSIFYFLAEEMKRRNIYLPMLAIVPGPTKTKEMRIGRLVPRFEWGRIVMAQGLNDLEQEMLTFPRSAHDDILDALASIEEIALKPEGQNTNGKRPHFQSENYERWFINNIDKIKNNETDY